MGPTCILTAEMDNESFAWLDGLRHRHFPPERNFLAAHLTLFHRLSRLQVARLGSLAVSRAPIELQFDRVVFLGHNVAVRVRSAALERVSNEIRLGLGGVFSDRTVSLGSRT